MENAAPQPTDDPVYVLLEQARQLILRFVHYIDSIFERLGTAQPSDTLIRKLTAYALVPAEAALRRVVLILAAHQPLPQRPKPRALPDAAKPRSGTVLPQKTSSPRAPIFNMREPQPRPKTGYLPASQLPRIRILTDDVLSAPPAPAAKPRDLAARFTRRLTALHAALGNPHAVAARWLRRHFAGPAPKPCPLSPHRIPGLRSALPGHEKDTLRNLTDLVFTYFATDTS
ncbi:MAG: hypothetical protein C0456_08705 [Hyphomonas sp.]|uniref:hypothetical protein n=1 Tax=Hyphomonas sp. TaxID=87 RepID=UPI001D8745D1|nr:hypothetical protein [Hyphomonas sp.]MBA4226700.1 hypothetical protein [Hyphomonas sp.]